MAYGQDDGQYPGDGSYGGYDAGQEFPMEYPSDEGGYPTSSPYPVDGADQYGTYAQQQMTAPTEAYPAQQQWQQQQQPYAPQATQQYPQPQQPMGYGQPMAGMGGYPAKNAMATVGLVVGISAMAILLITLALAIADAVDDLVGTLALLCPVLGIVAVILSIVGISQSKHVMGAGKGKATSGLILGIVSTLVFAGILLLGITSPSTYDEDYYDEETSSQAVLGDDDEEEEESSADEKAADKEVDGETEKEASDQKEAAPTVDQVPYTPSDGMTTDQLNEMLGSAIWEGHIDNGSIGSKFTFDSANHAYTYWKGDADPVNGVGDRISGTYEVYCDDDAYAYVDRLYQMGGAAKQDVSEKAEVRGEPVHYMILLITPQVENIGGVEKPSEPAPEGADQFITWECTVMPQSRHIQMINVSTSSSYDFYDSTVPLDQRETAATRLHDMVMNGTDGQGTNGSEG